MDFEERTKASQARQKEDREKGFERLLARPEVKFMLSMLPSTAEAPPDAMNTFMRVIFNYGFDEGSNSSFIFIAEAILRPPQDKGGL